MKLLKYKKILLIIMILLLFPVSISFARYVKQMVNDYILESQHFFFNSDKLTSDGKVYKIYNWSGTDSFIVQFALNNRKNNLLSSDSDITYRLSVSCDNGVECSINSTSGVIYKDEGQDDFVLNINPTRVFGLNDYVSIHVVAESLAPYEKSLSATFEIHVGIQGISYEIIDNQLDPYFILNITNTRQSYYCRNAYGSYGVGEEITTSDYLTLSDTDKTNFSSARITLSFDPRIVIMDTTNKYTLNSSKEYTTINGVSYINQIMFDVDPVSSTSIRFYKADINANYTYPIVNSSSIVNFSAL